MSSPHLQITSLQPTKRKNDVNKRFIMQLLNGVRFAAESLHRGLVGRPQVLRVPFVIGHVLVKF